MDEKIRAVPIRSNIDLPLTAPRILDQLGFKIYQKKYDDASYSFL